VGDEGQELPELKIRLLGSFDVLVAGESVAPAGAKRRALLALLALRTNEVVPVERLVDGIWGDEPPASAVNLVHTYVSLWRRVLDERLGPGAGRRRLERVGSGYRLHLRSDELDVAEVRRLAALGRTAAQQGLSEEAAALLDQAQEVWGDEVLADLRGEPLRACLGQLEEEGRALLQAWGEAELDAGRGALVVGAMQESLDREPLQETVAVLLMRALHEEGRSAEALSVFERTRHALADQLGASPGPRLAETHLQVLRQERTRQRPRPKVQPRPRSLPVWTDTFVGRDSEVAEVAKLMRTHRLVTVTGPGGAGKTRLAAEVATVLAGDIAPRFVDATVLTDVDELPQRVAAALGVDLLAGESAEDALAEVMADRDELVIVDNLEHLPGAGAFMDRLITAVPRLRLLATSRTPLGIGAEHRYPLKPLDVVSGSDVLASPPGPAVTLFSERASAVDPAFRYDTNREVVTEICRRLDGLPLAIELAAGWCATLSPPSVLKQLDHTLEFLVSSTGSSRPDRQSTLRATVEWSYNLLDEASQRTLRMLSVFRGGCTVDAAGTICARDVMQVLPSLRDLVERGLLVARSPDDGDPRFELLFTVREYALGRLGEDIEEERTCRGRHTAYFLDLGAACARGLTGADQAVHLDMLQADRDNIYEAISAALLDGDPEQAMSTAAGIWRFWQLRSHLDEGRRILQLLDEHAGRAVSPAVRARCVLALGNIRYWQLAYDEALSCYEQALELFGAVGDLPAQAEAAYDRAFALVLLDRQDEGRLEFADVLARYQELGDAHGEANALAGQALATYVAGDFAQAVTAAADALDSLHRVGDPFEIANATALVATTLRGAGRVEDAEAMLVKAITAHHTIGSIAGVAWGLAEMAEIAFTRGDVRRAALLAGAADSFHNSRHPRVPMHALGLVDLRSRLERDASSASDWERGQTMTLDEAVAAALRAPDPA
jgi:predicted ATPase/DNA-binding SARP family transcriptional activator